MTVGERLREAIEDHWTPPDGKRASIREFAAQLKKRGAPGRARQTIHSYLSDDAEPSLEFFREAADVLDVRAEWLALGSGAMTEEEERAREDVEVASRASAARRKHGTLALQHAVLTALGRGSPPPPEQPEGLEDTGGDSEQAVEWREAVDRAFRSRRIHPWTGPLADVLRRFQPSSTEPVRLPFGSGVAVEEIAEALRAPLDAVGRDVERMGGEELDDYVLAMIPVLQSLGDAPARKSPEERLWAARRDLEEAREDDLSEDIIERLEDRVETLEKQAEETDTRNEETFHA